MKRLPLSLLCLLTACPSGGEGDDDGAASETETATTNGPSSSPSSSAGSMSSASSATTVDPPDSDTDPDSETDTSVESDTDTDTDTDGAPACAPSTWDGEEVFAIDIGEWVIDDEGFEGDFTIESACTIVAVTDDGAAIDLELSCDDGGEARTVTIGVAAPAEGTVQLAIDAAVSLRHRVYGDELGNGPFRTVAVRDAASGALLLGAGEAGPYDAGKFSPVIADLDPIVQTHEYIDCNPEGVRRPLIFTFSVGDAELVLESGSAAVLDAGDGTGYAIDVLLAEASQPSGDEVPGDTVYVVHGVTL